MSIQALSWAFSQDMDPTAKLVLIGLANYADAEGICWPSYGVLCAATGLSERTIIRKIQDMEKDGLLAVVKRTRTDGSASSNTYQLAIRGGGDSVSPGGDSLTGGGDSLSPHSVCVSPPSVTVSGGVLSVCQGGSVCVSPLEPSLNRQLEPSENQQPPPPPSGGSEAADRFEDFWRVYPRKTAKGAARASWQKIKPGPKLFERILDAIAEQRESEQWRRDGGQFIPHASTWLNQSRWEDSTEIEIAEADDADGWEGYAKPGSASDDDVRRVIFGEMDA